MTPFRFYDQCIFCTLEAISQRYPNYLKSIKCKSHEKGEKKKECVHLQNFNIILR